MKKLVDGQLKDLTPEEIAEREDLVSKEEKKRPMKEWLKEIAESDKLMPRYVEAIIEVLSASQRSKLPPKILEAYTNKKLIRNRKPQEE